MKQRGYIALVLIVVMLALSDLVQRFVIAPIVWIFPSRRIPVLTWWQKLMAAFVLVPLRRVGGAQIAPLPEVPGGPGVLVVMNHQSLIDIPLVVAVVQDSYPRIVTRRRYMRWIPLISLMVRLYKYPVVDPEARGDDVSRALTGIQEAATRSDGPLVIFPEGTRTRDGEIGRFKPGGLRTILGARAWTVYLVVSDGFWQRARFKDFLRGMREIRGQVQVLGPFAWDDPSRDPSEFIDRMRDRMIERLAEMRAGQAA